MPNINLTDSRNRDAVVKAETTGVAEEVRYVDGEGRPAHNRKILKATVQHDYDTLVAKHENDPAALGKALISADPEVDMETCGLFLWGVSKVFVNSSDGIVYRIEQTEIVRDPSGKVKEERARDRDEANIDTETPLTWTGRKIAKDEAVRRYVFSSKLQIVHVNGLTYDFLYGMAKELDEEDSLMMVGGGSKGRDPLVFRRGSVPYRGFLEGRVKDDKYILLLHLSNLELKVPEKTKIDLEEEKAAAKETVAKADTKKEEAVASKEAAAAKKEKKQPVTEEPQPNNAEVEKPKAELKGEAAKPTQEPAQAPIQKPAGSGSTTSEDFGIWLKSIRMGKYLELFVDNKIDVDALTKLSDADLKELDIPPRSRKRLLKEVEQADNLHAEVAMAVEAKRTKDAAKKAGK